MTRRPGIRAFVFPALTNPSRGERRWWPAVRRIDSTGRVIGYTHSRSLVDLPLPFEQAITVAVRAAQEATRYPPRRLAPAPGEENGR